MNARLIVNFVAFQFCWFASVLLAARGMLHWAPVVALSVVVLHLSFTQHWLRELKSVLLIALLGTLCEVALGASGFIQLTAIEGSTPSFLYAAWFFSFWLNFATLLNVSLRWMHGRHLLAVLFGILGGPPAYYGARELQAVQLADPLWLTLLILAVYWGIACPVVLMIAQRLNPQEPASASSPAHVEGSNP